MPTASRLIWIKAAPEPGDLHFAECGPFSFEIIHTHDRDYLLQMWRYAPKDSPLLWWEYDGLSLDQAKARAERLADHHVPAITQ